MRRLLKLIPWAIATLVLVLVAWFSATNYYRMKFDAAVERLREAGVRVDPAQFNDGTFPDESFSAILLREAAQWREDNDLLFCSAVDDLYDIESLTPEEIEQAWDAVEEWVGKHEPFYEKVDQALRDPHCNFATDRRNPWNAILPSVPLSQTLATMYEWRVRVAEHRDRPARASLGDCMALLAWGRRVERGGSIAYGVGCAVDGVACELIQRIAGMRGFDSGEAHAALNMDLLRAEDESAMWDAFDGELATMIYFVRRVAPAEGVGEFLEVIGESETRSPWLPVVMTFVRPLLWSNGVDALDYWDRARDIIEEGRPAALSDLETMSNEWADEHPRTAEPRLWRASTWMFHRLPHIVYKIRLRHLAHLRVTHAGLNALRLRQITGRWPDPDTGHIDPFTGKPLMLVPEGDSVRIEAAVPWLDEYEDEEMREDERIYWKLEAPR